MEYLVSIFTFFLINFIGWSSRGGEPPSKGLQLPIWADSSYISDFQIDLNCSLHSRGERNVWVFNRFGVMYFVRIQVHNTHSQAAFA
jgi:hypothetical protein